MYMHTHLTHPQNERRARNAGTGIIPELKKQRQENYHKFKASLIYTAKFYLETQEKKTLG